MRYKFRQINWIDSFMKKIAFLVTALSFVFLFSGCATQKKMAFDDEKTPLKSESTVLLMTAKIKNNYKSGFQPDYEFFFLEEANGKDPEKFSYRLNDDSKEDDLYLIQVEVEKGDYVIRGFNAGYYAVILYGSFFVPIHENITIDKHGVYYLGHIDAVVRKRQGNEFKAGPSLPLIDQGLVGASGGTFDIKISDNYENDIKVFKNKFSALESVEIAKKILPEFNRARAQEWWEKN